MANKIIFLDIDGVFNSYRTAFGLGSIPSKPVEEQRHRFDWCAVGLIRRLTKDDPAVDIVLSSTWRLGSEEHWQQCRDFFDLPLIGRTPSFHNGHRGEEIADWLSEHPEVENYVIVDDDSDMLEEQAPHFVQTTFREGFLYRHFLACQRILDGKLGGLYRRERFWARRNEPCSSEELEEWDASFERVKDGEDED